MGLSTSDIAPRFNAKLNNAITNFAQKFNLSNTDIRILIIPKKNEERKAYLTYTVRGKGATLCNASFDEIVKLDTFEKFVVNEEKVSNYIINSLVKFSIGGGCGIYNFIVMIYFDGKKIKLALLKEGKIVTHEDENGNPKDYFTVENLF